MLVDNPEHLLARLSMSLGIDPFLIAGKKPSVRCVVLGLDHQLVLGQIPSRGGELGAAVVIRGTDEPDTASHSGNPGGADNGTGDILDTGLGFAFMRKSQDGNALSRAEVIEFAHVLVISEIGIDFLCMLRKQV